MTQAVLDKLREERNQARDAALALAEAEDFRPDDETFAQLETRAAELDTRIEKLSGIMQARAASDELDAKLGRIVQRQSEPKAQTREASLGDAFVRSPIFTEYPGRGTSPRYEAEGFDVQRRAPLSLGSAGMSDVLNVTTRSIEDPDTMFRFLDVVSVIPVSTNAVEIVTWAFTNNAAQVAEGAAKPESGPLVPTVTPLSLHTTAHWIEMTRQLIEDAPAIRNRVDTEMRRGVVEKINADAWSAMQGATFPTADGAGDLMAGLRKGLGSLQMAGYSANAVLLNPDDWADLDISLLQLTGNPVQGRPFWGLTPVPVADIAAGTAYVGDFRRAFEYYRRTNVSLYLTDSHASNFTSNIFTMLAEARGAGAVVRPDAVVEVSKGTGV